MKNKDDMACSIRLSCSCSNESLPPTGGSAGATVDPLSSQSEEANESA